MCFADREALQLQWRDQATGKKRTRSAGTADPATAEARRVDLEADLNAGRCQDTTRLTWLAFRQRFETEYLSGLRWNTRRCHGRTLDLFGELAAPTTLQAVTPALLSRFAALLRSRGQLPSTVSLRLRQIHVALAWAVRQELLAKVPPFPFVRVSRRRPAAVPAELFERLLAAEDEPAFRAYLLCGWLAGMRTAEARELAWDSTDSAPWLDLERNRIWFPAAACKGAEDSWVPLDPQLRAALDSLPRSAPTVFDLADRRGQRASAHSLGHRVVLLARKAGVRLTMRSLRKGFVSRYAERFPAQVVQRLARHSSITTTMAYYANIDRAVEQAVSGNTAGNTATETMEKCGK